MNLLFIKGDFSLIANKIDTLISHNNENLKEISNAIIASNKGSRFIEFISNDTLFTLIITTLVIFLVEFSKSFFKWMVNRKKKKELRSFIKIHIDEILPYIEKIENKYLELSNEATIDTGLYILPAKVFMFDFRIVLNSDLRELYNSFKEKNKIINVVSSLDSISEFIIQSEIYHDKLVLKTEKLQNIIKTKYDEFLKSVSVFIEEIRKNNPHKYQQIEEFKFLNDKLIYHYKNISNTRKSTVFYKETLRPILEYIVDNKLFRVSQNADKISTIAREFSNVYSDLDNEINSYKNQFFLFSATIGDIRKLIQKNIDEMNWK